MVRDKKVHEEVVCHIMTYALSMGFEILGLSYSPIKGPEGNIEYLLYIEKPQDAQALTEIAEEADQKAEEQFEQQYLALAKETVEAAHEAFVSSRIAIKGLMHRLHRGQCNICVRTMQIASYYQIFWKKPEGSGILRRYRIFPKTLSVRSCLVEMAR